MTIQVINSVVNHVIKTVNAKYGTEDIALPVQKNIVAGASDLFVFFFLCRSCISVLCSPMWYLYAS